MKRAPVLMLVLSCLMAAAPAALAVPPTRPTGMTVNDLNDRAEPTAQVHDGKCDWDPLTSGNQCTIRAAVMEANSWGPGPNINIKLAAGTYNLTIAGAGEDAAATGDLDVLTDVTFNGPGTGSAVILGGPGLGDRLIDIPALSLGAVANASNVSLSRVTLKDGAAPPGANGGGLQDLGTGAVSISGSSFVGNVAGGSGGGIFVQGALLTISGTNTFDSNQADLVSGYGGAIDIEGGTSMTLSNLTIQNNQAAYGGGVAANVLQGPAGVITMSSDTFTANAATASGGGLYIRGGTLSGSSNLVFDHNTADLVSGNGGGLDIEGSTVANLSSMTVSNGSAANGGGLSAFADPGSTGSLRLSQTTLTGNTATGYGGGLDIARTYATLYVQVIGNNAANGGGVRLRPGTTSVPTVMAGRILIGGNSATVNGGGIYADNCGTTCTVNAASVGFHQGQQDPEPDSTGNTATTAGAGIYANGGLIVLGSTVGKNTIDGSGPGGAIFHTGSGVLTLTADTIGQNAGGPTPGGVVIASTSTDVFTNLTIAKNSGVQANGIALAGAGVSPGVRNTIIQSDGVAACTPGAVTSLGHNLENGTTCGLNAGLGDLIGVDPVLSPVLLNDNGGGTNTIRPDISSPVINAGTNTGCPTVDQRYVTRPVGWNGGPLLCDIGAYEYTDTTRNSQVALTITASPNPVAKGARLTYTITLTNNGAMPTANTILKDVLPNALKFVSCAVVVGDTSVPCVNAGTTHTVTFPSILSPGTEVVKIVAKVKTTTSATNILDSTSASSETPDTYAVDNVASVSTQVV